MAKKKRKKIKYPIFVFSLVIGLGLIAVGYLQPDAIFGSQSVSITGLEFITVPLDPTTGGVFGEVVLGAPDVVPDDLAATLIGLPRTSGLYPRSPCSDNLTGGNMFPYLAPDFKIKLSGDPNQVDPEWWGSRDTGVANERDCAFAYGVWDISDLPNDFVASQVIFKLELLETRGIRNTNNPAQLCQITTPNPPIDIPSSTDQQVMDALYNTATVLGTFSCGGGTLQTISMGQAGVDLVNTAIVTNDKLTIGITPVLLDNLGTGKNRASTSYWQTQGSWFITGTSGPITCGQGFTQVDFRCVPITCPVGQQVNATNQCSPIICANDEILIGDICTPVVCNAGEQVVQGVCVPISCPSTQHLVGSSCVDLVCDVGFVAANNVCSVIQCPTGMELVGASCQPISCPTNTILNGNNCIPRTCPSGQISVNNVCTSSLEFEFITVDDPSQCPANTVTTAFVEATGKTDCMIQRSIILDCGTGTHQLGDICVPDDLNCPEGTQEFENVCVQRVPSLLSLSGEGGLVTPQTFVVSGILVSVISVIGIIVRRI